MGLALSIAIMTDMAAGLVCCLTGRGHTQFSQLHKAFCTITALLV